MLTIQTAKNLRRGDELFSTYADTYRHGLPARVRVTSVKTWKTRPDAVEVRYAFGLYDHGIITAENVGNWTTDFEEAKAARPPLPALLEIEIIAALAKAKLAHNYPDDMMDVVLDAAKEAAHAGKSWKVAAIRALKKAKAEKEYQDRQFDAGNYVN